MPQLDTSNWLYTFILTWLTLLTLMAKITNMQLIMKPKKQGLKTKQLPWTWPW